MISLFLLYFIGKQFYQLAEEAGEKKWLYAILGIVIYFLGFAMGGILLGIIIELIGSINVDDLSDVVASLMIMPFGLLACWLFYIYLKKSWRKLHRNITAQEIEDFGTPEVSINSEQELNK